MGVTVAVLAGCILFSTAANAEDGFPFGFEMKLEAAPQPGSKRIPTLEIGDKLEATGRSGLLCRIEVAAIPHQHKLMARRL